MVRTQVNVLHTLPSQMRKDKNSIRELFIKKGRPMLSTPIQSRILVEIVTAEWNKPISETSIRNNQPSIWKITHQKDRLSLLIMAAMLEILILIRIIAVWGTTLKLMLLMLISMIKANQWEQAGTLRIKSWIWRLKKGIFWSRKWCPKWVSVKVSVKSKVTSLLFRIIGRIKELIKQIKKSK